MRGIRFSFLPEIQEKVTIQLKAIARTMFQKVFKNLLAQSQAGISNNKDYVES